MRRGDVARQPTSRSVGKYVKHIRQGSGFDENRPDPSITIHRVEWPNGSVE